MSLAALSFKPVGKAQSSHNSASGVDVPIALEGGDSAISPAQPLAEGIGERRVTVENADFHMSHLRSGCWRNIFLSLCYWSVSLGEWKGNTLVVLGLDQCSIRSQQLDDGFRGGRRWLPEMAECIAQIFSASLTFNASAPVCLQFVTHISQTTPTWA